jgi:hypothetical protein
VVVSSERARDYRSEKAKRREQRNIAHDLSVRHLTPLCLHSAANASSASLFRNLPAVRAAALGRTREQGS